MKITKIPSGNLIIEVYLPVKKLLTNNAFMKEICVFCKEIFDARRELYEIKKAGYICYDCVKQLGIKEAKLTKEDKKRVEAVTNENYGD